MAIVFVQDEFVRVQVRKTTSSMLDEPHNPIGRFVAVQPMQICLFGTIAGWS